MFKSASESSFEEITDRKTALQGLLKFGIHFLDDSLRGIAKSDSILIGAVSGSGKTETCCSIATTNVLAGKKVYYMALEAERYEIERRIKYKLLTDIYFSPEFRKIQTHRMSYDRWRLGEFYDELKLLEDHVAEQFKKEFKNLFLFYKEDRFGLSEMIQNVVTNAQDADLFLIDHVHYFDFDDQNENRALKEIAKTIRALTLEENKPIVAVAHLRKRDRHNDDLVPGLDEFHGSSDLTKIATKVITFAPGERTESGLYETFIRIPKNRTNASSQRFIGRLLFDPKKNAYQEKYQLGPSHLSRKTGFEELAPVFYPDWARRPN